MNSAIRFATAFVIGAFLVIECRADTIAQWTFQTSVPTTGGPLAPEVGVGVATSNTGGTFSNPAGYGSTESWSSNGWDTGEYFQFTVSTLNMTNVQVNWAQTGSGTGPRDFVLQYSTDGVTFTNGLAYSLAISNWNAIVNSGHDFGSDLSAVTSLNNSASVFFRLTQVGTSSITPGGTHLGTVAATGTGRVDNFTITAVPEPSSIALVSLMGCTGLVFAYRRRKAKLSVA